jgi:ABC-type glycerol-3-phosphate transport system substrate-binding protein
VFMLCSGAGDSKPSLDAIKAQLAAAGNKSKALKPKLPGFPKAGAAAAGAGVAAGQQLLAGSSSGPYDDDADEDEDWDEDESTPAFEITFDETGRAVGPVCGVR